MIASEPAAALVSSPVPLAIVPEAPDFDSTEQLEVPPLFAVRDEESANWVIKKVTEAEAYAKHVREYADREIARALRDKEWFLQRFGPELESWTATQIAGGRRKSVALPAGVAGFRMQPAKLVVRDEAAAMTWARKNAPAAVVTTERLSKSALNEHLAKVGEVPDGAVVEPAHDSFFIR